MTDGQAVTPYLEMREEPVPAFLVETASSGVGGKLSIGERQVHQCQCLPCEQPEGHPDQAWHDRMNQFLSRLDEQQLRWYVGLEAERLGSGGDRLLAQITGMDPKTIGRGRDELAAELADRPRDRVRQAGGGRYPAEKKIRRLENCPIADSFGSLKTWKHCRDSGNHPKLRNRSSAVIHRMDASLHSACPATLDKRSG